jgi:hypothetical protein
MGKSMYAEMRKALSSFGPAVPNMALKADWPEAAQSIV